MSLYDNIPKHSLYFGDVEDFLDLQTIYDSLCVKSAMLLDLSNRLVKKVKCYEKEFNELKPDQQLIEESKVQKLVPMKANKQLEVDKTKILGMVGSLTKLNLEYEDKIREFEKKVQI